MASVKRWVAPLARPLRLVRRHPVRSVLFLVVVLCWWAWQAIFFDPRVADTGEGESTPEERALIERAKQAALAFIAQTSKPDRLYKRDAHPYAHGCVTAHFRVLPDLEPRLRHGVLAQPGHVFPAWLRFSNGTQADDRELDGRGLSIKLMDVPGDKLLEAQKHEATQDFAMINYSTFIAAGVAEYFQVFEGQARGKPFSYFVSFNPFDWHLRELRIGLDMILQKVPSPLVATYYTMVPFKLGPDLNVKYSARACDLDVADRCELRHEAMPDELTPHYLRDALVRGLTRRADREPDAPAARFEFRVQVQDPEKNMPIEDASIEWREEDSPYVPVAEILVPPQRFDGDEQNRFCENLSFTPWHALPAHRPIGGLNRARRVVYEAISKKRHEENGVARHEPRGFCLALDGRPCPDVRLVSGGTP